MKTVVTAMALLFVSALNAQALSLGPAAGFGHSFLNIKNNTFEKKFFPSYTIGARFIYSIASDWGISADLKFSNEGGRFDGSVGNDNYEHTYRAHYIRIPFQGIYFFGDRNDAVRPKIAFGPALGFLIGGRSTLRINDEEASSLKTKNVFEGFDFGLHSAIGAGFRLAGNKWLNTDLTWYHGLTNVSATVSNIKNRSIGINIGLIFPIGNP